jgi:hypothetical protein
MIAVARLLRGGDFLRVRGKPGLCPFDFSQGERSELQGSNITGDGTRLTFCVASSTMLAP